jgi:hypothetical protein
VQWQITVTIEEPIASKHTSPHAHVIFNAIHLKALGEAGSSSAKLSVNHRLDLCLANFRYGWWVQLIAATHSAKVCAGVL